MPNIKSASKRDLLAKKRNSVNKANKSALRTTLKKFDAAIAGGDQEAAVSTYKVAVKSVDRAVTKGLIHKNNAANKKSKMAQKMNALQ